MTEYDESLEDFITRIGNCVGVIRKEKSKRKYPWSKGPWKLLYKASHDDVWGNKASTFSLGDDIFAKEIVEFAPDLAEAVIEYYEWCKIVKINPQMQLPKANRIYCLGKSLHDKFADKFYND